MHPSLDIDDFQFVRMKVRGDGKIYRLKFIVQKDEVHTFYVSGRLGAKIKAGIRTIAGQWQHLEVV